MLRPGSIETATPDYVMEVEDDAVQPSTASTQHGEGEEWPGLQPYQDEPIADPAWIAQYNEERRAKEERRQLVLYHLNGTIPVIDWYVKYKTCIKI